MWTEPSSTFSSPRAARTAKREQLELLNESSSVSPASPINLAGDGRERVDLRTAVEAVVLDGRKNIYDSDAGSDSVMSDSDMEINDI
ncbi:hypothetical protein E2P81_ATG07639 [Venturia nashicola]|nr:hypothetical protein E2P81_ATG07639 [Venturia nashicola]